eukprot:731620-Pleurochrysis_carterae.AAC.1
MRNTEGIANVPKVASGVVKDYVDSYTPMWRVHSEGLFSIPPVRATGGRALLSDIHDLVAKRRKQTRRQGLGEEISQ